MKKSLCFFAVFLLVFTLVSCNLSAENEAVDLDSSKKLVKVCFTPANTKSLDADYSETLDVNYYLTATPLFTRGERSIVGEISEEELMEVDGSGNFTAGYFEQGSWSFTLNAYLEDDDKLKTKIASETIESVYISETKKTVSFKLDDVDTEGKADISIKVQVPKLVDSGASIKAKIDGTDTSFAETPTISAASNDTNSDLIEFSATIKDVTAGVHQIQILYYIQDDKNQDVLVNSEIITVRVVAGADMLLDGEMLNEKYASGSFSVVISSNSWSIAVSAASSEVTAGTATTVTCTPTGTTSNDTVSYQWYVDGTSVQSATNSTYSFSASAPGIYCITCITKVNGFAKSASAYVYVNEASGD